MKTHISTRQLADGLGVSESSVKRWSDQGLIPAERTAGGHRRLPMVGVLRFVRGSGLSLVRPELLGLPAGTAGAEPVGAGLLEALADGDEQGVRRVLFGQYLGGSSVAEIGDGEITPAFRVIGERWACGELHVYEERRAVEVMRRVLLALGVLLPEPPPNAPRALGATLEGDWYSLPTLLVEMALREVGWNASSYGSGHPAPSLAVALGAERPRLVWLSLSHIPDLAETVTAIAGVLAAAREHGAVLVVGGRALDDEARRRLAGPDFAGIFVCHDLQHIQTLARQKAGATPSKFERGQ